MADRITIQIDRSLHAELRQCVRKINATRRADEPDITVIDYVDRILRQHIHSGCKEIAMTTVISGE
jgi:hypothetical protein